MEEELAQHSIKTERVNETVTVIIEGETIAETDYALKVVESGRDPVIYVPKNDIKEVDLIKCGDYHDPQIGHAELYTIRHGARDIENAAWSFDEPTGIYPELMGKVAFYADKVQEIRVGEGHA